MDIFAVFQFLYLWIFKDYGFDVTVKNVGFFTKYNVKLQVEDSELADVAAVSAGNDYEIGNMVAEAMSRVGRKGVVTLEEGKSAENDLYVVEGMQFDRGYISPYFVTDSEKMAVEYENCKVCGYSACRLHGGSYCQNFFSP